MKALASNLKSAIKIDSAGKGRASDLPFAL
jgi:hypothetical protein